jgi:uncharacterized membrane protein YedE/YeeE
MNPDWLYGLIGGLMIGSAAALLLLGTGRIAGISGILGGALAGLNLAEGATFLAGLIGATALYALTLGAPVVTVSGSVPLLAASGLLVGFGTRLGGGCTSGHGVCGISRLSPRSLVATGTFMVVAAVTVYIARHLIGGY